VEHYVGEISIDRNENASRKILYLEQRRGETDIDSKKEDRKSQK
jgi:hypothetical protein